MGTGRGSTEPDVLIWEPGHVYMRFLEAAETWKRLPKVRGPKAFGNAMPEPHPDPDDAPKQQSKRPKPSAGMITRADQVLDWNIKYLVPIKGGIYSVILCTQVDCRVHGTDFKAFCEKIRLARSTAYNRLDKALQLVTKSLNNNATPVIKADLYEIGHLMPKTSHKLIY